MYAMTDRCDACKGLRFNRDTLEIIYKGKNIAEMLDMTINEALLFFDKIPKLGEKLWVLSKVGLGYIKLGQPSNTLSGGEAQRMKIARELAESRGEGNLYIMDEPFAGVHQSIKGIILKTINTMNREKGITFLIISHEMTTVSNVCHRITVLNKGEVISEGTMEEVANDPQVIDAYLGG